MFPEMGGTPKSSKEVKKQYFPVTDNFYLMELTLMKGGTSHYNDTKQKNKRL